MPLRFILLAALTALAVPTLAACNRSPYDVHTPLAAPLTATTISVQVTASSKWVEVTAARRKYAIWMEGLLKADLKARGFTVEDEAASVHLHMSVDRITRGTTSSQPGAGTRGRCQVSAELFDSYPGDLVAIAAYEKLSGRPSKERTNPTTLLAFETKASARASGKSDKTHLAKAAARQCVKQVGAYLEDARE